MYIVHGCDRHASTADTPGNSAYRELTAMSQWLDGSRAIKLVADGAGMASRRMTSVAISWLKELRIEHAVDPEEIGAAHDNKRHPPKHGVRSIALAASASGEVETPWLTAAKNTAAAFAPSDSSLLGWVRRLVKGKPTDRRPSLYARGENREGLRLTWPSIIAS